MRSCLFVLVIISLFTGCNNLDGRIIYNHLDVINEAGWDKSDTLVNQVEFPDSGIYVIDLQWRTESIYKYKDLSLLFEIVSPDSLSPWKSCTFRLRINEEKDEQNDIDGLAGLYDHTSNIMTLKIPYKGLYTFEISHKMHEYWLMGVQNIGMRITCQNDQHQYVKK